MVKLEIKGDVRVIPCPKCGTQLKIANAPPSTASNASVTCAKCHTWVVVERKR